MKPLQVLLISFIIVVVSAQHRVKRIVGGQPAVKPPVDDPLVWIYKGEQQARIRGIREDEFYAFRGIRFAEPPVGRFRFQRPRRAYLQGDYNATSDPPPCPQPNPKSNGTIGSEDCLFLNVYTPKLADGSSGLSVIFWIHGGGYRHGSASQYGVHHLLRKRLVVVSIQYRLGSLGFLSTGTKELPGNAGLFDMALALDWVQDYITFFGGNPALVKVCGQGTGASSAITLALSKVTQPFLGGVLALSGSVLSTFALDKTPLNTAKELAGRNNCPTSKILDLIRCLQELRHEKVIEADSGLQAIRLAAQGLLAGLTGNLGVAPVIEGKYDGRSLPHFLEDNPVDILKSGGFPPIPLLTGVVKDETSTAILGAFRTEILNKIATVPGYVDSILGGLIGKTASLVTNTTSNMLQQLATNYFSFLSIEDTESAFAKLIEATGDALFNLPAFQTAQLWSSKAPTFLYSFEHLGKEKAGPRFLQGLPLVNQGQFGGKNKAIGHGDDLAYIFDGYPLRGKQNTNNTFTVTSPEDVKVRDIFTDFIAQFAGTDVSGTWPAFTQQNNNYLKLTEHPEAASDFRFCQMALWAGLVDRLQTSACQVLGVVGGVGAGVGNTRSKIGVDKLNEAAKPPSGDNVLGILKPPVIFG